MLSASPAYKQSYEKGQYDELKEVLADLQGELTSHAALHISPSWWCSRKVWASH
jgi:hypothetical protein